MISKFLFVYLRALYSTNITEYMESQTTGIKNLLMNDFFNIEIPIPPIEIQNKIADEAMGRREKAFKLQEEAKKIIEEAKKEVESILF